MKKNALCCRSVIASLAVLMSLLAPLSAADKADTAANLLQNPGFEEDSNGDGQADCWFSHPHSTKDSTDPVIQTIRRADDAADGRCYMRLSREQGKAPLNVTEIISEAAFKQIKADPEKTLVLKGKIRASSADNAKARINIQLFVKPSDGGAPKFAGQMATPVVTGNGDWEEVAVSFKPADILPPNTELAYLEVNLMLLSSKGSADFDEVSLSFE